MLTSRFHKRLLRVLFGIPADAGLFVVLSHDTARSLVAMNVRQPNLIGQSKTWRSRDGTYPASGISEATAETGFRSFRLERPPA